MTIKFNILQDNLAEVINTLTGELCVWANQNAPTPDNDCIILKIDSIAFTGGTDYQSQPNNLGEYDTHGERELLLSITSMSDNSLQILLDLIESLQLELAQTLLCEKKIALGRIESQPLDITTQIGKDFEAKAIMTILFKISKNYFDDAVKIIDIVESVEISGVADGDSVQTPQDIDIEV